MNITTGRYEPQTQENHQNHPTDKNFKVSEIAAQFEAEFPSFTPQEILQVLKNKYYSQHGENLQQ
jgi:hypothetical protein